jgi:hypothetical protein
VTIHQLLKPEMVLLPPSTTALTPYQTPPQPQIIFKPPIMRPQQMPTKPNQTPTTKPKPIQQLKLSKSNNRSSLPLQQQPKPRRPTQKATTLPPQGKNNNTNNQQKLP